MDKLLAGQVLHPSGNLQSKAHQVLYCRVLWETEPSEDCEIKALTWSEIIFVSTCDATTDPLHVSAAITVLHMILIQFEQGSVNCINMY